MVLFEKKYPYFAEGAYGVVFFTSDGMATKVFKRTDASQEHVYSVFNSEVEAYKLATNSQALSPLVPAFYGPIHVDKITNAAGVDISNEFYLEYSYQMERLNGDFIKISNLSDRLRTPLFNKFNSEGIAHTSDVSVVLNNEVITGVIDFAIEEFRPEHSTL